MGRSILPVTTSRCTHDGSSANTREALLPVPRVRTKQGRLNKFCLHLGTLLRFVSKVSSCLESG